MKVSEIFYSVQGEGDQLGRPAIFLRLAGCNLRCTFCDTKYAFDEFDEYSIMELVKHISVCPCRFLVITGGEPLLYQKDLVTLLSTLRSSEHWDFWEFQIETNGSIEPCYELASLIDRWVISPKLSNSGNKPYKVDFIVPKLDERELSFKFVVDKEEDFRELRHFLGKSLLYDWHNNPKVYIMPQAITIEEQNKKLPMIIEFAKKYKYLVSPRLQLMAFGNKRGV